MSELIRPIPALKLSAADLVKRSASQITYFNKNGKPDVPSSPQLTLGEQYQQKMSTSHLREMRGIYKYSKELIIYYCFDEIIDHDDSVDFMEYKVYADDRLILVEPPEWFLHSSLIQVAFYASLAATNPDKQYETATFFRRPDVQIGLYHINPKRPQRHILVLNDNRMQVIVSHPWKLRDFYVRKALHTNGYLTAKDWDSKYKHLEWEELKQYFKYKTI